MFLLVYFLPKKNPTCRTGDIWVLYGLYKLITHLVSVTNDGNWLSFTPKNLSHWTSQVAGLVLDLFKHGLGPLWK